MNLRKLRVTFSVIRSSTGAATVADVGDQDLLHLDLQIFKRVPPALRTVSKPSSMCLPLRQVLQKIGR